MPGCEQRKNITAIKEIDAREQAQLVVVSVIENHTVRRAAIGSRKIIKNQNEHLPRPTRRRASRWAVRPAGLPHPRQQRLYFRRLKDAPQILTDISDHEV